MQRVYDIKALNIFKECDHSSGFMNQTAQKGALLKPQRNSQLLCLHNIGQKYGHIAHQFTIFDKVLEVKSDDNLTSSIIILDAKARTEVNARNQK